MKQYIISEEELKELIIQARVSKEQTSDDYCLKSFLKSRQPVELVAEGEIYLIKYSEHTEIGNTETWRTTDDKSKKIFIQKDTK